MRIKTFFLTLLILLTAQYLLGQGEPDINEFIAIDHAPEAVNMTEIKAAIGYPQAAIDSNISGVVVARVLIDENGTYVKHKIIKTPSPVLSDAVNAKITGLIFSPAMQGTKSIAYWVNVPFQFRLKERSKLDASYIEEAVAAYSKKIEENPKDYTLYLQRGVQYSNAENFDKALEDLDKSISLNPQKNKKKSRDYFYLYFSHVHRGKAYSSKGEWELAKANYNAALQTLDEAKVVDTLMEQTLPTVYLERGIAYSRLDMYQEAMADYKIAMEKDPENACMIQGFTYDLALSQKDFPLVVQSLDELIACETDNAAYTLHYNRGYYKIKAGDYEGAIIDLDTVARLSNNIYLRLGALNQKAEAFRLMGKIQEALAETQKAMDINLLHPTAYFFRGKIQKDEGKTTEACENFEKAIAYGLEGDDLVELEALKKEMCK